MAREDDLKLARAAALKRQGGRKPTVREAAALRRVQKTQREAAFAEMAREVPQKIYRQWSGRQTKQLQDIGRRYGLTCDGKTIDLPALIRQWHDLLAEHAHRIPAKDAQQPGCTEAESPALERKRAAEADIAEMKRDEMAGRLKRIEQVREILTVTARELRRGIERLGKRYGGPAQQIMEDSLNRALEHFELTLSGDD